MRALAFVCVLSVALPGAPARAAGDRPAEPQLEGPPQIIARVGDRALTSLDVQRELDARLRPFLENRARMEAAGVWTHEHDEQFAELRRRAELEVRRLLLREALVEHLAEAAGIKADEVTIEMRISSVADRVGGYEELARREGRSLAQIRDELRRTDAARKFYRSFVPQGTPPSPGEIRAYYHANRQRMREPARFSLSIITLPVGPDRETARERAEALRRELQYAPERFAARARELSTHAETAQHGGVFTVTERGERTDLIPATALPREWMAIVQRLKPGRVSDVIESAEAFLLIKLRDVVEGRELSLSDAAEKIEEILSRIKQERIVSDWTDYYLGRTYVAGVDLASVGHSDADDDVGGDGAEAAGESE